MVWRYRSVHCVPVRTSPVAVWVAVHAWSDSSLPRQSSIYDPVYRSNTTTCRGLSSSVDALRIEPYGFEVVFYARCYMQTSENSTSRHFGE
jgi:hypothetical protein